MRKLFEAKHGLFFDPRSRATFIDVAASILADLNAIHPFREGNGRAQLSFLHLVGVRAGHPLRFERVRQETLPPAIITSFAGDIAPLVRELDALGS